MPSVYPGALDSFTDPIGTDLVNAVDHAGQHEQVNDAVEKIEAELGIDPAGASVTVKARLDTHEADGDAHHAESHTVASHSDTTATGAELETLTDGSDADALHTHNLKANTADAVMDGDAAGGDLGGTYPNPTVDDGADGTAIHDDTAGEIAAITAKASPVDADLLLIEDSAAANAKKRATIQTLPVIHRAVSAEISALTQKSAPTTADHLLIEDAAASDAKKRVTVANLADGIFEATGTARLVHNDPGRASFTITTSSTGLQNSTYTVPANYLSANDWLIFEAWMENVQNQGAAQNHIARALFGGTSLGDWGNFFLATIPNSATAYWMRVRFAMKFTAVGASGTVNCFGQVSWSSVAGLATDVAHMTALTIGTSVATNVVATVNPALRSSANGGTQTCKPYGITVHHLRAL